MSNLKVFSVFSEKFQRKLNIKNPYRKWNIKCYICLSLGNAREDKIKSHHVH